MPLKMVLETGKSGQTSQIWLKGLLSWGSFLNVTTLRQNISIAKASRKHFFTPTHHRTWCTGSHDQFTDQWKHSILCLHPRVALQDETWRELQLICFTPFSWNSFKSHLLFVKMWKISALFCKKKLTSTTLRHRRAATRVQAGLWICKLSKVAVLNKIEYVEHGC